MISGTLERSFTDNDLAATESCLYFPTGLILE